MSLLHRHSLCSSMLQAVYSITWAYVVWSSNRFPTMNNKNRTKWFLEPLSFISVCVGRFFFVRVCSLALFIFFFALYTYLPIYLSLSYAVLQFSWWCYHLLFFERLCMSTFSPSILLLWMDRRCFFFVVVSSSCLCARCRWNYWQCDSDFVGIGLSITIDVESIIIIMQCRTSPPLSLIFFLCLPASIGLFSCSPNTHTQSE